MNEQIDLYVAKYPEGIFKMFNRLRQLIFDSVSCEVEETLWARLPSFYVGEHFVRLIPFKDHINVEADAITDYKDALAGYKITPKGMLQIYENQEIPAETLSEIFRKTLEK